MKSFGGDIMDQSFVINKIYIYPTFVRNKRVFKIKAEVTVNFEFVGKQYSKTLTIDVNSNKIPSVGSLYNEIVKYITFYPF